MTSTIPTSLPFTILNAFTSSPYGGNPAVVVFLPSLDTFPDATLFAIAQQFNQPIVSYVTAQPLAPNATEKGSNLEPTFGIRWFTTALEPPMCGHGSLAAARAIRLVPGLVPPETVCIRFSTPGGRVAAVRRGPGEVYELELQAGAPEPLEGAEALKVKGVVARAIGRDVDVVRCVAAAGPGYDPYILAELDESVDLASCKVNTVVLQENWEPYAVNVLTTRAPTASHTFVSRMFAPAAGVHEDPVCGTAHAVLTPYWARKDGVGSKPMRARQVSARGGEIGVQWLKEEGKVRLHGEVKLVAKGDLFL